MTLIMDNLCRLCGSEEGIKVNIFEPGTERVKRIHKILPITVSEYDLFPKQICHHCSFKVDQFFEFRILSIKTQEIFKRNVWLRDKKIPWRDLGEPPMVKVNLNSVQAVSPNEKQISPSYEPMYEMNEYDTIVIEDSPPHVVEPINYSPTFVSELDDHQNPTENSKRQKSRSRSLWDTKSRKKKKSRKSCKIAEVFSTSEQEYQNFNNNDIENNPLHLSPINNIENSSFDNIVENNSFTVKSPISEFSVVEKGILTDDTGGVNIVLQKYILITKIPRVGNVYTCERCGRTFLNPQPASLHTCPALTVEEDGTKEEAKHHEDSANDTTKDCYQCSDCGVMFTRHSLLMTHRKKHNNHLDSSSDDNFQPFNKRKKQHTKRKSKPTLLNTNSESNFDVETNRPSFFLNFTAVETNITRHSLLSSDSE